MVRIAIVVGVVLCSMHASPTIAYTPPPASQSAVGGVDFQAAAQIGKPFKDRFDECDAKDTCNGKKIRYKCSTDRNRNTVLLRLDDDTLYFDGKMGVDADGSFLSRAKPGETDQKETSLRYPLRDKPSLDADRVPFIVVPGGQFRSELGVELGDLAAVVVGDKVVYAIVADIGPPCKLGEGSIQLHEMVGHGVCKQRDAAENCLSLRDQSIPENVLYFVFPGSKQRVFDGLTPENINERISREGRALFEHLKANSQ